MGVVGEIRDIVLFWTEESRRRRAEERAERGDRRAEAAAARESHEELRQLLDEQIRDVEELVKDETNLDRKRLYKNQLRQLQHRRALMLEVEIRSHPAYEGLARPVEQGDHELEFLPLNPGQSLQLRSPEHESEEKADPDMQAGRRLDDIAIALSRVGQQQAGVLVVSEAIDLVPDSAHFLHNRASIRIGLREWEAAKDDLERAVELDPEHHLSYNALGLTYAMLGDEEAALATWETAAKREPDNPVIWVERSIALLRLNRLPEALEEIDRAIDLAPNEPEFQIRKAHIYEVMGELSNARQIIRDVLKKSPDNRHALGHLASELIDLGNYEEALPIVRRVAETKPHDGRNFNLLAICLDHLGHHEEALQSYENAVENAPTDSLYRLNRASLLVKMGHDTDAEKDMAWLMEPRHLAQFRQRYAQKARDHAYFAPLRSHPTFSIKFQHLVSSDKQSEDSASS